MPISAGTALQALVDAGRVQAGQSVLVIGASGGVGTYAVQLAKAFGAEVTGVCSTAKLDVVTSLGADRVVDYRHADFADGGRRYDLILDIGGGATLSRLRRALAPRGTVVFVGSENGGNLTGLGRPMRGALLSPFLRQRLVMLMAKERASDLQDADRPHRLRSGRPQPGPQLPPRRGARRHATPRGRAGLSGRSRSPSDHSASFRGQLSALSNCGE